MYVAIQRGFAHKAFGTCFWQSMPRTRNRSVRFMRSITPFWWGQYGAVRSWTILHLDEDSCNYLIKYAPLNDSQLLLLDEQFLFEPFCWKCRKQSIASDLSHIGYSTTQLEWSSMNETKYRALQTDVGSIGPHASVWTRSTRPDELGIDLICGTCDRWDLPRMKKVYLYFDGADNMENLWATCVLGHLS